MGRRTAIAFLVVEAQSGKVGHWSKRILKLGAFGPLGVAGKEFEPEMWRSSPANRLG